MPHGPSFNNELKMQRIFSNVPDSWRVVTGERDNHDTTNSTCSLSISPQTIKYVGFKFKEEE